MSHTAGGWNRNIAPASKYPIIYAGRNTHVAQVITRGLPESEAEANANLIAAAPDMLAALCQLRDQLEAIEGRTKGDRARLCDQLACVYAAITKALGK